MSSVPYIFANQTGNIALSDLDANFANVKANVDYASYAGLATTATTATTANTANTATTAGTVTTAAQPNITSVGILTSVSVSGNVVTGNITSGNVVTGNITGGNLLAAGNVSATGNVISGNAITSGIVSGAGNAVLGNVSTRVVNCFSVVATSNVFATGNVTSGNIITAGSLYNTGSNFVAVNYANITANAANTSLSTTISRNILIADNTGYTHTINMPGTPKDGQLTMFSISGNTVILVVGTGTVAPSFAGSTAEGTSYTYVYRDSNTTWYRTN
jgi:hypothetical protein